MPYPASRPKVASQQSHIAFSDERAIAVDMPYAALRALIRDHEALNEVWVELPVRVIDGSYALTLVNLANLCAAGPECNA